MYVCMFIPYYIHAIYNMDLRRINTVELIFTNKREGRKKAIVNKVSSKTSQVS
jgi:hypothetical protein